MISKTCIIIINVQICLLFISSLSSSLPDVLLRCTPGMDWGRQSLARGPWSGSLCGPWGGPLCTSRCSISMMVKCASMMVEWVDDHKLISPSLTSNSPSLTSISPSLPSILLSLAWSKPSFAHLTIIEMLHRLQ